MLPLDLSPLPPNSLISVEPDSLLIHPVEPKEILESAPSSLIPPPSLRANLGFLSVFGSTFVTIFLAELGDKTQFATLLLAAQSHNPVTVFVGAATALVATSLIGVLIGRWLSQRLSPATLERATAILLLFIAGGLIVDVMQM